jgi:hypothetical protein
VVSKFKQKISCASRISIRRLRDLLLTTINASPYRGVGKTSKSAAGAVYDRAYFVDCRKTRGHRPRLQMAPSRVLQQPLKTD